MINSFLIYFIVAASQGGQAAPAQATASTLHGIPISEAYRNQFRDCDRNDHFEGVQLPIVNAKGKTIWRGCKGNPNELDRLEFIDANDRTPKAIIFEAKMAEDADGSDKACASPGKTDQCKTAMMLKPSIAKPCPVKLAKYGGNCLPIDAGNVPYIVIPGYSPKGVDGNEFARRTGITVGDVGVVIVKDKVVPVVVGDVGPGYKIGEGSTALLRKLSYDGKLRTFKRGVQYIVFPGTSIRNSTSADTLETDIEHRAMGLYKRLVK